MISNRAYGSAAILSVPVGTGTRRTSTQQFAARNVRAHVAAADRHSRLCTCFQLSTVDCELA
jgi:hypothetical protein